LPYRYLLNLGYKGTHFHGWQIQPGVVTIQETLNIKLSLLLKEEIYTIGAGRTDTGVHAPCFYAHFDSENPDLLKEKERFLYHLNCILPIDIAVYDIFSVKPEMHARFSALSRTYMYRISRVKNPFNTEVSWFYSKYLDIDAMNNAAKVLLEYTDFTSFSKLHTDVKTNNCFISSALWVEEDNELQFYIRADRFLRNMVRAIVGTLMEVGVGKLTIQQFRELIERKDRAFAGPSVDARGLHLITIEYPDDIYY
jgi:tRNA pseudouridine38-40 synthase